MATKSAPHLIIGAGVFGLTTALELARRGYTDLTVLDRAAPPVSDGSSVDISRIIRADYADPLYHRLAREAYRHWTTPVARGGYADWYHGSGFVLLANAQGGKKAETAGAKYLAKCKGNLRGQDMPFTDLPDAAALAAAVPQLESAAAAMEGLAGYLNPAAGWADAGGAVAELAARCRRAGVRFRTGAEGTVTRLLVSGGAVRSVEVASGVRYEAERVVLATGAWTGYLLDVDGVAKASGQPIAFVQLDEAEAKELEGMPVVIDLDSGWFVFPPTPGARVLKVARHGYGYTTAVEVQGSGGDENDRRVVSAPKRDADNATSSYLPDDADLALRNGLERFLPKFAGKAWSRRRMCWYTDTQEGDFIVDWHPQIHGLFVATGGSGHGFKFLPIIGRYLVDCFENRAPEELRRKWALKSSGKGAMAGDGSRGGPPQRVMTRREQAKL